MLMYEVPEENDANVDRRKMFGFNQMALQMNHMSEELRSKLPPTDSRLRPDIRLWENS